MYVDRYLFHLLDGVLLYLSTSLVTQVPPRGPPFSSATIFKHFIHVCSLVDGADLRTFFCDPLQTSPYSGFRLEMMYIEK